MILIRHVDTLCRCLIRFRGIDDPLLDICGEIVEGILHVDVALCRNFHERYAQFICQLLSFFYGHHSLLFPIALVPDQDLINALSRVLLDVRKPGPDV